MKVLALEVAKVDIGEVIGKRGRTARAMPIIPGAASAQENKGAILEIAA